MWYLHATGLLNAKPCLFLPKIGNGIIHALIRRSWGAKEMFPLQRGDIDVYSFKHLWNWCNALLIQWTVQWVKLEQTVNKKLVLIMTYHNFKFTSIVIINVWLLAVTDVCNCQIDIVLVKAHILFAVFLAFLIKPISLEILEIGPCSWFS